MTGPADWDTFTMHEGSVLWRHHSPRYPADQLRPAHSNPTGRFDCPDPNGWASSYYAFTPTGTLGETLLRDFGPGDPLVINSARLLGTAMSRCVTVRPVDLIDLTGPGAWGPLDNQLDLIAFPTSFDPGLYQRARTQAGLIQTVRPDTDGLMWRSARNNDQKSVLLWNTTPDAPVLVADSVVIDATALSAVASLLTEWDAVLSGETGEGVVEPKRVEAGTFGWT